MKKLVLISILFLLSANLIGQQLYIKDASTLQAIPDVLVLGSGTAEIADVSGRISLTKFNAGDSLLLQHPSYYSLTILLSSITDDLEILLTEKSIKLDEIVVSVSRWAESSAEFPNKVVGVTAKDIGFSSPQTTADALMQTGEVFVQKSQLGGGSPMIRGFAANRILLTVDGIRLNNAIYRSGNLQNIISVDANSLERTEVIFGPGSVQYGSDALGGVVNMMTKQSRFVGSDPTLGGSAFLRYSSANNERTGHVDLSYSGLKFASVTSISYSGFDDLKMGSNGRSEYLRPEYVTSINGSDVVIANEYPDKQVFTGFKMFNFIQKLKYKLAENLTAEVGFYYSNTNNIPRYDRLIQYRDGALRYANWYYGPQEWLMTKLDLLYTGKNKLFDVAKLQVAYQLAKESRHDRNFGSDVRRNRFEEVDVVTVNADFAKPLSEFHNIYYGVNLGFNRVGSTAFELNLNTGVNNPSATRYPDGSTYNNFAAYINYEYKPSERFNFLAGLRYSLFTLKAIFDTNFYPFPFTEANLSPSAPSGSVGFVYTVNPETILRVNVSTAFRAPNIDDIGKVFDSEPGNVVVPNPTLEPEYAYNFDVGVSQNFGDNIQVDLTGFYTYLDNAMVRRDYTFNGQDSIIYDGELSKVQALTNAGSAFLFGFNAKLLIDFSQNWSLISTLNYTQGKDDENFPLRHVTPTFGATHLVYKNKRIRLDLYSDYSAGFTYNELAPDEQAKPHIYAKDSDGLPFSPSWLTLNFKSVWQISKNVQVNLGLENILDNRYRTYSSGIVAPGRNIIIGLRGQL
jgi:hemoglobin/transferrin/lactoferrin receptor protein